MASLAPRATGGGSFSSPESELPGRLNNKEEAESKFGHGAPELVVGKHDKRAMHGSELPGRVNNEEAESKFGHGAPELVVGKHDKRAIHGSELPGRVNNEEAESKFGHGAPELVVGKHDNFNTQVGNVQDRAQETS